MRVRWLIVLVAALPALASAEAEPPSPAPTLEGRVSRLRGKLAPDTAKLRDLQVKVGAELAAAARTVLLHREELGAAFELESASYALDGEPLEKAPPALARGRPVRVLERRLRAGPHRVSAELVYRVRAPDGAAARRLDVRSSHAFDARPGSVTRVTLVTHERGGATAEEERAAVRFELSVTHDARRKTGAPSGDAPP